MSVDEALDWLLQETPCLSFAGAGVSIPAPTCAPSVAVPLAATTELLATVAGRPGFETSPAMQTVHQRLLPESCYGSIATVAGTAAHLELWSSYAWHDAPAQPGPLPNAGHHLLARLADRHRTPVLTTNFDCFIERAAERQGLRTVVGLPDWRDRFPLLDVGDGEVAVWKLHGSALEIDTIRSQAADLARSSHRALRNQLRLKPARLLIAGYSGRDFDIFPLLAEYAANADCLWVDLAFGEEHRARLLPRCRMVTCSFEDLARRYWKAVGSEPVDEAVNRPTVVSNSIRVQFAQRVHDETVARLRPVLAEDPRRAALALATAVATVAEFGTVDEILGMDPQPLVRALLLQSFVSHSLDQHLDAERAARQARRGAWHSFDVFGLGRAEIALTYARVRRFVGTIREPGIRRPSAGRFRAVVASVRLVADVFLLAPLFMIAGVFVRGRHENRRHYDALDFSADYVEQLIRFGAMSGVLLSRLPWRAGGPALRLMWRTFGVLAGSVGYMRGVLNIRKYLNRNSTGSESESAVLAASLVGDSVAGAIAARNAAADRLRHEATDGEANRQLLDSYRLATSANVPSLQLKILLIMHRYGIPLPADADLDRIISRLQGEADRFAGDQIRTLLRLSSEATVKAGD